mgnify:CR=1 FL=1
MLKIIKEKLGFVEKECVPLPSIYKTLIQHLITEDYIISECQRILFFDKFYVTYTQQDKLGIIPLVFHININDVEGYDARQALTPINFYPTKMCDHDISFWEGAKQKISKILMPQG